jgi:ElaB/YqjD/DUF883 family membrane-anchored ribosome-binding protein
MGDEISNTVDINEPKERLKKDFQSLSSQAQEVTRAASSLSGESVAAARAKLSDSVAKLRDGIRTADSFTREKARDAVKATDSYVHENPWQAIAVGVVIGLLMGAIARGGRR